MEGMDAQNSVQFCHFCTAAVSLGSCCPVAKVKVLPKDPAAVPHVVQQLQLPQRQHAAGKHGEEHHGQI